MSTGRRACVAFLVVGAAVVGSGPAVADPPAVHPSAGAEGPAAPAVKNGDLVFVSNGATVATQAPRAATYDRLTDGEVPAYSPDGRWIAFVRDGVRVRSVADGTERLVSELDPPGMPAGLTWSPDASRIAVAAGADLVEVDVATGATRVIHTSTDGPVQEPAWSPDGTRIAYSTGSVIRLVRPDGTGLRKLTKGGAINSDPDWSPDSRRVAFITNRYAAPDAHPRAATELVVLPRSGQGEPVRVSHLARPQGIFFIDVAWSPDGRKIAALQFNADHLPTPEDTDERFKVRAYLPDGSHSYSLTGPIVGDDGPEGLDWAPLLR
ncbi:TolB family protein [Nocardioides abyssi]|uniref:Uncharacterized protein n=1 Tax=Nocardioides abyssi TaxID=3058370 RepID=A0ABT8ETT2_9ACTN|nr:hypothetical protein [Nocardioides abyssi]MDN4161509.1 hypothetical protein [Nocardioides abyssi]